MMAWLRRPTQEKLCQRFGDGVDFLLTQECFSSLRALSSIYSPPAVFSVCDMATHQILYSFKSRCGNRLKNGDFDRSSDALVLAVRDRSSTGSAAKNGSVGGSGGSGDTAGELVAVVELTIRQADGSLPFNWPFPAPWRRPVSPVSSGGERASQATDFF